MRFAVNVPNFGDFADPRAFAQLAQRAEQAGWDGVFVWDHILHERDRDDEIADPWILLAAAALATERLRLGAMITPVARRRPSTLARQVTTLDRLSRGRMIFGAGLGAPIDVEYGSFGEPTDPRVLAARLDEGLEALDRLWRGDAVTLHGDHVRITDVTFAPTPIQRPRPPVWIGGNWPHRRPMRRAARWDGAFPMLGNEARADPPDPALVREVHAFLTEARADGPLAGRPFDLSVCGRDPDVAALADAGVTWWQETMPWDERLTSLDAMLARVDEAPPVSPRGTR